MSMDLFLEMMYAFEPTYDDGMLYDVEDPSQYTWIINKTIVMSYLLFIYEFVDSVQEYENLNKFVKDFKRANYGRQKYIVSSKSKETIKKSQWSRLEFMDHNSDPIYNYIFPNSIKCTFRLYGFEEVSGKKHDMFTYYKYLEKDEISSYFENLKFFWEELHQGMVYIACDEYPTELQGYNPINPLMGHKLYGMSVKADLGQPDSLKDVLVKTVSRWKIKATPGHDKTVFFQIFDGYYGDLIFSSKAMDKKDADFGFSWGGSTAVEKTQDSDGMLFLKTVMLAMKGASDMGDHYNHEIRVDGDVSLDHLVGISYRAYEILLKNKKLINIRKLLSLISDKRIIVFGEDEELS